MTPPPSEAAPTLTAWAADPSSYIRPFPPSRGSTAWPVGDLPATIIAADLAALGYARERAGRPDAVLDGLRIDPVKLSHAIAAVLDSAADTLSATPGHAHEVQQADREHDLARATFGYIQTTDPNYARYLADRARLDVLRAELAATTFRADVAAMRATAADIRRSPRAARHARDLIIADLPIAAPSASAEETATEWLSAFDTLDRVKRADIVRAYVGARSPGGLSEDGIRALASRRWGNPGRYRGEDHYRPALVIFGAAGPAIADFAASLGVDAGALDAWLATQRPRPPEPT